MKYLCPIFGEIGGESCNYREQEWCFYRGWKKNRLEYCTAEKIQEDDEEEEE
jgi:hypothetical protein